MEEIVIQLDCCMCKGYGEHWDMDENNNPIKVRCDFCGGVGGSPQPVTKEEYEKYFRGCRIIK
jgi:hypothetical protein